MIFTHYTDYDKSEFVNMCKRRCERFKQLLNSDKKILFIWQI